MKAMRSKDVEATECLGLGAGVGRDIERKEVEEVILRKEKGVHPEGEGGKGAVPGEEIGPAPGDAKEVGLMKEREADLVEGREANLVKEKEVGLVEEKEVGLVEEKGADLIQEGGAHQEEGKEVVPRIDEDITQEIGVTRKGERNAKIQKHKKEGHVVDRKAKKERRMQTD